MVSYSMYLSFFDEKPFYHELDFQSPYLRNYIESVISPTLRNAGEHDISSIHNLQNIIVFGPRSSGKTSQIYGLIATLFNTRSIYHIKNNIYENNFQYKSSSYHIEFSTRYFKNSDISDDHNHKGRNKNIEFVRNIVETPNILIHAPKLLYIRDFDCCSSEMQKFFLRLIEKSISNVRFILEIRDISKLSEAILSRFHLLRTSTPTLEEATHALRRVYRKHCPPHREEDKEEEERVIQHAIRYSHISNFTYAPRKTHFYLKAMFGILHIYISTLDSGKKSISSTSLYIPTLIQKAIELKELLFSMSESTEKFFESMVRVRELILEIFVNNVPSNVIQKYMIDTGMEYFQKERKIQNELFEFGRKIDSNTAVSNKDVLFTEYLFIFLFKKIYDSKKRAHEEEAKEKVETKVEVKEVKEEVKEVKKRGRKKKEPLA